jgi:hypothetical protein
MCIFRQKGLKKSVGKPDPKNTLEWQAEKTQRRTDSTWYAGIVQQRRDKRRRDSIGES